jgi:hypothetical protein
MIAGEGSQLIHRPAKDIYEFVLDPENYKRADLKIGTVYSITWRGNQGEIHYSGRFRGFPTPSVRQTITVQPYRRIDVRSKPGTLTHFMSRFHGVFTFEELDDGTTRVFHREELVFRPPLNWFIEPLLRSWLESDTPQEVWRLKALLETTSHVGVQQSAS